MLDRNDINTIDEMKTQKLDALVESTKKPASNFDKNLAILMVFHLILQPTATTVGPGLMIMPNAIWLHVLSFLNLENDFKICRELSYLSNSLGQFFRSHLRKIRLKQLLQHVVYGNQKEAEIIIKSNPTLLLSRGTVEDYSFGMDDTNHRKNEGTAYQLALGADDVKFYDVDVCMVEMIRGYLIQLPQGETEIAKQTMQRYPVGWETEDENRAAKDLSQLHQVISILERESEEDCRNTIDIDNKIQKILYAEEMSGPEDINKRNELKKIILSIAKTNSEIDFESAFGKLSNYLYQNAIIKSLTLDLAVLKAIYQFRNYLEPRGVTSIGNQFNVRLLEEAFKLYNRKEELLGNRHDSPKYILLWQKVIGYIQRFLPASYAQIFAQGVYYIVGQGENLKRSLEFRNDKNIFYFPLDSAPGFKLGYDLDSRWIGPYSVSEEIFTKLYHAKKTSLQCIILSRDNHTKSRCSIM